jgi:hypothetical protein
MLATQVLSSWGLGKSWQLTPWLLGSNAPLCPHLFIYRMFGAMDWRSLAGPPSILQSSMRPGYEYATNCDREIEDPPRQLGCCLLAARAWLRSKADCLSHQDVIQSFVLFSSFLCREIVSTFIANNIESSLRCKFYHCHWITITKLCRKFYYFYRITLPILLLLQNC